jgi:acetyl esterase/lipase
MNLLLGFFFGLLIAAPLSAEPVTFNLWPGKPPGETKELPPEADQTKAEDNLIAGRRIIKLGNVSTPQLIVYRPPKEQANGAAIIIAPGGGFHILAYDLEGTEVAEWLNSIGVTAIVLKYRVPFRDPERPWLAALQDAQRAISLVRSRSAEWGIDAKRIGILGFSAGGHAAGMAALLPERQYAAVDNADKPPSRPDFAVLIYPGGFLDKESNKLRDDLRVTKDAPPMFLAHAHNDEVSSLNSALLYVALKKAGVSAELHIYAKGGHGYGLRQTNLPVTTWPARLEAWLNTEGWTKH